MAIQFGNLLDLEQLEVLNFVVQKLGADPSGPNEARLYYNTVAKAFKYWNGSTWRFLDSSSGGSVAITELVEGLDINISVVSGVATISHTPKTGASNQNLTGAQVIATMTLNNGHVVGVTTRNLTLSDLGFTGAADADKYTQWKIGASTGADQDVPSNAVVEMVGEDGVSTEMLSDRRVRFKADSTVVRTSGNQTIAGNKVFSANVVVEGDLTVNGTTTSLDSETVRLEDSVVLLNRNQPNVAPSVDAGIVAKRGNQPNVAMAWVEALGAFVVREVGAYEGETPNLPTTGAFASLRAGSTLLDELGLDAVQTGSNPTRFLVWDPTTKGVFEVNAAALWAAVRVVASTTVQGVVELATNAEALAMSDTGRAVTPANLAAISFKTTIGNGTNSSFTITHNLNSLDVRVEIINVSNGATIYADVKRGGVNQITVAFGTVIPANSRRVLITKV